MARRESTTPHPHAEIFPLHEGQPLWDLSDRIKKNGQREPIVTLDDMILDGRRRELACFRAGVEPKYRKFGSRKEDGKDPLEFVIDINLHRRHLGEGEKALAAARYATATRGQMVQVEPLSAKPTNEQAAAKFDVGVNTVKRAKAVLDHGTPELQEAVKDETITVSDAAKVATEPPDVQREAVEAVKTGKAKSVKAAVEKAKEAEPDEPKDALGHVLPNNLIEPFAAVARFKEIDSLLRKVQGEIHDITNLPGGEDLKRFCKATGEEGKQIHKNEHLNCLKRDIKFTRPHSVCPWCEGMAKPNCKGCQGNGWVTEIVWKNAEDSIKAKLSCS